jgi:hypothetical protein
MNSKRKKQSEVDRVFSEGTNAIYLVLQGICPECNKLFRLVLLTSGSDLRKVNP